MPLSHRNDPHGFPSPAKLAPVESPPTARSAGSNATSSSHTDILVPQLRVLRDELAHELDALDVLQHLDLHALRTHVFLRAFECDVFADDHPRDSVKQDRATAHRTRAECRVNRAATIDRGRLAAGVFQAIHFGVVNDAAALHALVVTAPNDLAVEHEHRADGNAAFREALASFVDGGAH